MPVDLLEAYGVGSNRAPSKAELLDFAAQEAQRQGVDPALIASVLKVESGGNPAAVSKKGARGPMQLMPGTARDLGVNIDDPVDNIKGGVAYLGKQLKDFGGDRALALAAYNAGPGAVRRAGGIPNNRETREYVPKVLDGAAQPVDLFESYRISQAQPAAADRPTMPQLMEANANKPSELLVGPWNTGIEVSPSVSAGINRAGGAAVSAMDGLKSLVGMGDSQEERELNKQANRALDKTHPVASTVGNIAANAGMMYAGGGLLGGAGEMAALRGAPALGEAFGAVGNAVRAPRGLLESVAGGGVYGAATSAENRALGTIEGAAGGGVGYGLGKGIGNVLGRVSNPIQAAITPAEQSMIGKAQAMGLPLNAAQQTGSKTLRWIDSALDNLPYTSDMQAAAKGGQRDIWQRAVLGQLGENSNAATSDVLGSAYSRLGKSFNALSARNSVDLGADFFDAIAKVDASKTPFSKGIGSVVDDALELAAKGNISGKEYQAVRTSLTKASKGAWANNPELGQALKTLRNALDDAASASVSPADKAAWSATRAQYKALKTIEKAADTSDGRISPLKLYSEVGRMNPSGMRYGQGDQTLPDLARVGKQFVAEKLPDSGTAQRSWYMNMLQNPTAGLGGLTGLVAGGPAGAAVGAATGAVTPLAAQKALWSGSRYLRQGLLSQPALDNLQTLPGLLGYYGAASSQ